MTGFSAKSLLLTFGIAFAGLSGSCAPAPRLEGAIPSTWSQIVPKTFLIARPPGPETGAARRVREAVAQRLTQFGFEENASGRFRVETSLSVRPLDVVTGDQRTRREVLPPALCRRLSYALSVAVTDRATGTPLLRRSARAARCPGKEDRVADALADLIFKNTVVGR